MPEDCRDKNTSNVVTTFGTTDETRYRASGSEADKWRRTHNGQLQIWSGLSWCLVHARNVTSRLSTSRLRAHATRQPTVWNNASRRARKIQTKTETEADDSAEGYALERLRAIKPAIQASGDRAAIDSYNAAVREIKQRRKNSNRVLAADCWERRVESEFDSARDFEDAARNAGRKMRGEVVEAAPPKPERRAVDNGSTFDAGTGFLRGRKLFDPDPSDTNDYVNAHNAAGAKMREKQS